MKKKSFREQMSAVIEERFRNDDADCKLRHLNESTTPAAETLITYIRQWPEQHQSRNQSLGRLLECDRWNAAGELVLERNHKGKAYPVRMPLVMAFEAYQYGDQKRQFWPSYSFVNALKRIPANATEDWIEEIKGLFIDINRMPMKAVKTICLGKWVKSYGVSNPHTYASWERQVGEFADAQKAINEFVITRAGWEYLTTENLQNPKHKAEMSKVLEDILAGADAVVEPSFEAIKEQDRRLYIRQDATQARNSIKALAKFFNKYGNPQSGELGTILDLVDALEKDELTKKDLTKV